MDIVEKGSGDDALEVESSPSPISIKPEEIAPEALPVLRITPEDASVQSPSDLVIQPDDVPTVLPSSTDSSIVLRREQVEDLAAHQNVPSDDKPPICPFDREEIDLTSTSPDRLIVICARCKTPHHKDCWEANGGKCTILGCGSTKYYRRRIKGG